MERAFHSSDCDFSHLGGGQAGLGWTVEEWVEDGEDALRLFCYDVVLNGILEDIDYVGVV